MIKLEHSLEIIEAHIKSWREDGADGFRVSISPDELQNVKGILDGLQAKGYDVYCEICVMGIQPKQNGER